MLSVSGTKARKSQVIYVQFRNNSGNSLRSREQRHDLLKNRATIEALSFISSRHGWNQHPHKQIITIDKDGTL